MNRDETIVRLHENAIGVAISTNAADEALFMLRATERLAARLSSEDVETAPVKADAILGILRAFVPEVVEIACKLRGYKADVIEQRVIIAGKLMPEDVVEMFDKQKAIA